MEYHNFKIPGFFTNKEEWQKYLPISKTIDELNNLIHQ